jgi:hypothetical protein
MVPSCIVHTAEINVPHLPRAARVCHIVLGLCTYLLISISQLCNAGCTVLFLTDTVSIGIKNTIIMHGVQARATGLWHLDLSCPSPSTGTLPITMSLLLPNDGRECKVTSSNLHPNTPTEAPMAPQLQTCLTAVGSATRRLWLHSPMLRFSHQHFLPSQQPWLRGSFHQCQG